MVRTYIVTGSASGIGATTAALLEARGDRVIGVDLRDATVTADLSTREGREAAVAGVLEASGGDIDAVIACAGLAAPAPVTAAVNFFGVTELLEGLRPALARSAAPRVAVTSSLAALMPSAPPLVDACLNNDEALALGIAAEIAAAGPQIGMSIYTSSKRALSRWVRRESITESWAGASIALNAVAPGTVITPMMRDMLATPESVAMVDAAAPMPLNYHQQPESVANLLIWLTSVENTHVTGQTISVDGGADASLRGDDAWSWSDAALTAMFTG